MTQKRKYELERSIILENWQKCNSFRKFSKITVNQNVEKFIKCS